MTFRSFLLWHKLSLRAYLSAIWCGSMIIFLKWTRARSWVFACCCWVSHQQVIISPARMVLRNINVNTIIIMGSSSSSFRVYLIILIIIVYIQCVRKYSRDDVYVQYTNIIMFLYIYIHYSVCDTVYTQKTSSQKCVLIAPTDLIWCYIIYI